MGTIVVGNSSSYEVTLFAADGDSIGILPTIPLVVIDSKFLPVLTR